MRAVEARVVVRKDGGVEELGTSAGTLSRRSAAFMWMYVVYLGIERPTT
jgi:hypothetical protein